MGRTIIQFFKRALIALGILKADGSYQRILEPGIGDEFDEEEFVLGPPHDCPRCCSRIEISDGNVYNCVGLNGKDEVDEFLVPAFPKGKAPKNVTEVKPCGWSAPLSTYGTDWV